VQVSRDPIVRNERDGHVYRDLHYPTAGSCLHRLARGPTRSRRGADVTPGLSFLPGDIKYESRDGNIRIYFPIITSIVLSVLLTLILRFFG
jgi:hypothetical protein